MFNTLGYGTVERNLEITLLENPKLQTDPFEDFLQYKARGFCGEDEFEVRWTVPHGFDGNNWGKNFLRGYAEVGDLWASEPMITRIKK